MENILGNRIKELRKEKKITQKALADAINITSAALSTYEKGLRHPSGRVLTALANYFGVSANYLLGETNEPFGLVRPWESDTSPSDFTLILQQLNSLYTISSDENKELIKCIYSTIYRTGSNSPSALSTIKSFVTHWEHFAPLVSQTDLDEEIEHFRNRTVDSYNKFLEWAELTMKLQELKKNENSSAKDYDIKTISPYDLLDLYTSGFSNKKRDL